MANTKKTSGRKVTEGYPRPQARKTVTNWVTPSIAVIVIGGVEAYALSKGINGVALTSSIAAIAGIAGFKLRDVFTGVKPGEKKK